MIAIMLTIELLTFQPQSPRATTILQALQLAAPTTLSRTTQYEGRSDLLLLWGPGAPDRVPAMRAQIERGGHVLALDLAYWQRDRKFRVSIDAAHPQRWVMRHDWPADRFRADAIPVSNHWDPTGPVIVAGIGRKARVQYGSDVETWERQMMTTAAQRWRRPVFYRKKQHDAAVPTGAVEAPSGQIEQVLHGASLVITWHSNVAVDAIRLGIPVICRDGAAAAVCPSTFSVEDPAPLTPVIRDRFLQNLAWFQWAPHEAQEFWRWVPEVLS